MFDILDFAANFVRDFELCMIFSSAFKYPKFCGFANWAFTVPFCTIIVYFRKNQTQI